MLFGVENLRLILLQRWSNVAFSICQGLLAYIVGRHRVAIGVGDFNVVTERSIETYFQVFDPGSCLLAFLEIFYPLFSSTEQSAYLVDFRVMTGAKDSAVCNFPRGFLRDGPQYQFGKLEELLRQVSQARQIFTFGPFQKATQGGQQL